MPSSRPGALSPVRRPATLVVIVVAIGVLLSLGVYRHTVQLQAAQVEAEFVRRAEIRTALTREIVNAHVSAVRALHSLFQGSDHVRREEFGVVSRRILERHPGIVALEWVPIVPQSARAALEAEVTREIGRPFEFTEPGPNRTMIRARDRAEHYPILYLEPLAGNERAFGLDVQGAPTRPFLEQARQTRTLVATTPFDLVQGMRGIVLISPVFPESPIDGTNTECLGFVQGVFRLEEMLAQDELSGNATDTLYLDESATTPAERLLYYSPAVAASAGVAAPGEAEFRRGLHRQFSLDFGDRHWIALHRPAASWLAEQSTLQPELWLISGFAVTALLAGLVAVMACRTAAIEREVAERTAELEESRRQLNGILHALPGMAFRAHYHKSFEVFFASEGTLALTGYPPSDFIDRTARFRDLIHPDDLPRVRTATKTALDEHRDFEIEYRLRTRDSREKWVLARGHGVYESNGTLSFVEGLVIDITARKQAELEKLALERKLLETQKLESLGLLAGGIAHDFNNLLTGIMGHASLARHRAELETEIADHLRKIEAGAGRAAELCQQMLAYSGRGRFLVENIELGQLIRDTLPLLRGALSPRAHLRLELSREPAFITADATQIRQIVMNLILNAGEALGASGGDIVVRTARRPLDQRFFATARVGDHLPPGEYVILEVADTGCGMSTETLAKIFDPFFTTKFTGRGLGLAAVLGIVRGHSGALKVQSEPGAGSTFTLALPPGSAAPLRGTMSATPWHQNGKALVIDDEAPVREITAELLGTFGISAVLASDGPSGIAEFARDPTGFNVVFLDLTMPGMDGEETLAALRSINPNVRVLLVSGYSENERITQLASFGPLVFLQKPFTRGRLQQKLREILA